MGTIQTNPHIIYACAEYFGAELFGIGKYREYGWLSLNKCTDIAEISIRGFKPVLVI